MDRPLNTLFMLMSVDGKISTGDVDTRDVDKDFPLIKGIREGLNQYYELEKWTDLYSLNTGRVMAKIGVNTRKTKPKKTPASFIIIDSKPHLKKSGVTYLTKWVKKLYLVTSNKSHPAFKNKEVEVIYYPKKIKFNHLFKKLKQDYNIKRITIQSGGTLNSTLIRNKLIDKVSIVVAPCLIGGKNTSTVIDGKSIRTISELKQIKALRLINCKKLKNSYLQLEYKVINDTEILK